MRALLAVLLLSGCATALDHSRCPPLPEIQPHQSVADYTAQIILTYKQCRNYVISDGNQ